MFKNKMAIKRGGVYFALLVLSFLGYTAFNQFNKISFIEPLDYYELDTTLNQSNDSNLLIGVIGDSWAVQRNIDSVLNQRMIEYNIPTRVISQGYYGGTSKRIYSCMFLPLDADSTIQDIIQAQPQYCLVYSGINDSFRHCGDEFYSYHTRLILKTLIHYLSFASKI